MARDVRRALKDIAIKIGKKDEDTAEKFIIDLLQYNRYHSGKENILTFIYFTNIAPFF